MNVVKTPPEALRVIGPPRTSFSSAPTFAENKLESDPGAFVVVDMRTVKSEPYETVSVPNPNPKKPNELIVNGDGPKNDLS
jgi:hypothetical protein